MELEFLSKGVVEVGGGEFFVDLRVEELIEIAFVAGSSGKNIISQVINAKNYR